MQIYKRQKENFQSSQKLKYYDFKLQTGINIYILIVKSPYSQIIKIQQCNNLSTLSKSYFDKDDLIKI